MQPRRFLMVGEEGEMVFQVTKRGDSEMVVLLVLVFALRLGRWG